MLAAALSSASPFAHAATPSRSLTELQVSVVGLTAGVEPANPIVPKQTASGLKVVVKAAGRVLDSSEVARLVGGPFELAAELSGPGLPGALSLPLRGEDAVPSPDPLVLTFPGLPQSGDYEIDNLRLVRAGRSVLDVAPRRVTLRVIEQILVTSVATRPLSLDEIRDRGVALDAASYLGFEFAVTLKLESAPVEFRFPVVFDRQGVPVPTRLEPPPEPLRSVVSAPLLVPVLLRPAAGEGDADGAPPDYGLADLDAVGVRIPSLLVIPGSIGYLKQFFSAQLMVGNGAPIGSGLVVRDVTGTLRLPPGADGQSGTADDPLALPELETGPQSGIVAVLGDGNASELQPGEFGRADLTLRGEREGRHDLDFDIRAELLGLPIGPVPLEGTAHGVVLVRNAYFDVTFTVPTVVRADEEFSVFATVTNIGQGTGQDVKMTLDGSRLSGARLLSAATQTIAALPPGDAATLEYRLRSEVTGEVVASYLRFDTSGGLDVTGRLNFVVGVGERRVAHSPDTLVLPAAVAALPSDVVRAAMRVLGQAWSAATATSLPPGVVRPSTEAVYRKGLAVAEAGLRLELGQPLDDALRDLLLDLHGDGLDPGFDQVLRETGAGRDLDRILGVQLEPAVAFAGGALAYEENAARIAASGAPFLSVVLEAGGLAELVVRDGAGRATSGDTREVPGAVVAALGHSPAAPWLGWIDGLEAPPYVVEIVGVAEGAVDAALTLPSVEGGALRARIDGLAVGAGSRHRIVYDPSRPGVLAIETDATGDGTYEHRQGLAPQPLASEGPRLVSAVTIGPETLDGASPFGTNVALLFDRVVSESDAAVLERYEIADNSVLAAKRQLSGRLVFLALEQPEGPLVPTILAVSGIPDERGAGGERQELALGSRLVLPGAVVTGRVLQAGGQPVAGALVTYSNTSFGGVGGRWACSLGAQSAVAAQRTDAAGRFTFRYVPQNPCGGPFRLETNDPDTGALRGLKSYVRVDAQRLSLDLVLIGHGRVEGVVTHAGGVPASGARVRVVSVTDSQVAVVTTSDEAGHYSVDGMTVGAVTVTAVLGANLGRGAGRLDVAGGSTAVNVTLDGNVDIIGTVRKLEGGVLTPLPGIDVVYSVGGTPLGLSVTDADGAYRLLGVPAGPYRLDAGINQRDRTSLSGSSIAGQKLVQNLVIEVLDDSSHGTVRGTVRRLDGSSMPDAWVSDNVVATRADALGQYELTGVALGATPRTIQAVSPDGRRTGSTSVLLTQPGQIVTGADIQMSGVGAAVFQVVDAQGAPVAGASVGLQGNCLHPCGCRFVTTDAQGLARFGELPFGPVSARAVVQAVPGRWDTATGSTVVASEQEAAGAVIRMSGFGSVTGTVANPNGTPAHGASVELVGLRVQVGLGVCALKQISLGTITTDVLGAFRFEDVHVGSVQARATSVAFPRSVGAAGNVERDGDVESLELRLVDTMAGVLSGTVWLPDGTTGAGPEVEVTASGLVPDVTVRTDAQGRYAFAQVLPAGAYLLTARDNRPGGTGSVVQTRVWLQPEQAAQHDLRLKARSPVRVRVVDGAGAPVDGALVRVKLTESDFPHRSYEGTIASAADQPLELPAVFEGDFSVSASDNFARGGRASGSVPPHGLPVDVTIQLTTVGSVAGRFLWADGQTPLPFATVRLYTGGRLIGQQTTAGEGEIGSFAFDYVPAGSIRLEAEDSRSGRTGVAIVTLATEGEQLRVDVLAQAAGRVQGVVTLNDQPTPGAEVRLRSGSYSVRVTADADARYGVDGVPAGTVTATADLGNGFLAGSAQANLVNEGETLDLPVSLHDAATVVGQVLAAGGAGPGAVSLVTLSAAGRHFTTTTGADGSFRFELVPAGTVQLLADALGGIDCSRESLVVEGGETALVNLTLRGVGAVEGEARDSAGPLAGALTVKGTGAGCVPTEWRLTLGPSGQFRIPELVAGTVSASFATNAAGGHSLRATSSGDVVPGATATLTLLVEPSGTLRGTVRHDDASPAVGALVRIEAGGRVATVQSGLDGAWQAGGVPVGPVTVRVAHAARGGVALLAGLNLIEGATLDVGVIELIETPLAVLSVSPVDGATGIAVTQPIQVTFNAPLAAADQITVRLAGAYVPAAVVLSADKRTVTLTSGAGWPDAREITVEVGSWVTDVYERRLGALYLSRFRTVDLSPPRVISVTPAHRAIQVDPAATVLVRFDEPIVAEGDLQAVVRVTNVHGPVVGTVSAVQPDSLLFSPAAPLVGNLLYTVTVNGARDQLGHVQTTGFTSTFATPDIDPPVLRLDSPAPAGWTSSRRPLVRVLIEDPLSGPDGGRATLRLDGFTLTATRAADRVSAVVGYDLQDGVHTVEASGHDRAGNLGELAATFRVDTGAPAAALIAAPTNDQVVSGVVAVAGSASDTASGVSRIEFLSDGQRIGDATPASGWSFAWNTAASAEGAHLLTARAVDVAGNTGPLGPPVRVIVNNRPLSISITSPATGIPVKTSVFVSASPSEAVARVEFRAGGAVPVIDQSAPYEAEFALASEPEGDLTILATAIGFASEVAEASRVVLLDRTPPAAPNPSGVHAEAESGSALVLGIPGAVELSSRIRVENPTRATSNERASFLDGSFALRLAAEVGEALLVTVTDGVGNVSDPLVLTVAAAPSEEPSVTPEGLQTWARSGEGVTADGVGRVESWADRSGTGNGLRQEVLALRPRLALEPTSGREVLRFDGADDVMKFTTRHDGSIRSVFAVLRQSSTTATWRQFLGDAEKDDFYPGWTTLWSGASAAVLNGQTWLNGRAVNGTVTERPKELSVLSVITTAGVTADRLFHGKSNLPWIGDVAELLVYDEVLGPTQRKLVEDYLARRYALYVPTVATPLVSPDGATFVGSLTVTLTAPTPGSVVRYTLDGGEPTETSALYLEPLTLTGSATLRARAFRPGHIPSAVVTAGFVSSGDFSPLRVPGLALWVRSDAGIHADGADRVARWSDQSGRGNDLVQPMVALQPKQIADQAGGLPVLRFDGSDDTLTFTNRFDGTIRAVFAVLRQNGDATWRQFLGDNDADDFYPGWLALWGGSGWTSASVLQGQTWLDGRPAAVDAARPQNMAVLSVTTTAGVTASRLFSGRSNHPWCGDITELVIYEQPLTNSQRKSVEDYLALKYAVYQPVAGAPEFTPDGGTFVGSVEVRLQTPTPGATVYYTTDGSEPTEGSQLYADPFTIDQTTTVRARAFRAGAEPSPITIASFTKSTSFTPADVPGLALWVSSDAETEVDAAGRVSAWRDQSGNENHLVQPTLAQQPKRELGQLNGLPVLRFDGTDDSMAFTSRLQGTIRAVFAVLKQNGNVTWRQFLGDALADDFYPGWATLWGGAGWTSAAVLEGQTWLNGIPADGAPNRPTTMSVLSVITTAGVTASRLFHGKSNYPWCGDIAELLIYDQPPTASQRKAVEDYLTLKYAVGVGTVGAPEFSPNGGTFTETVAVELQTATPAAEVRYTTDGSTPNESSLLYTGPFTLTQTTTVGARGFRAGMNPSPVSLVTFAEASDFSPATIPGLALWTRSDAGLVADSARRVSEWRDQSPRANHLVQGVFGTRPSWEGGEANGLPVVRFDGNDDFMWFTSRLDGTIRAVFAVLRQNDVNATWRQFLGDAQKDDFYPGWKAFWSAASPAVLNGETWLDGVQKDGTDEIRPTTKLAVLSVTTTAGVTADRLFHGKSNNPWVGDIAELIIYDRALTSSERKSVEDYLALKYAAYVVTAAAPEFTPNGGSFDGQVEVSIRSATPGAEIRYTLDDTEPTESSTLYTGPITLTTATLVRARAFRAGASPSPVAAAYFAPATDLSPGSVPGLLLWVRADLGVGADAGDRVSVMRDLSGNANDLAQPNEADQPKRVLNAQNGLPVIRFDGDGDVLLFKKRLSTIRTVFWVISEDPDAEPGYRFLLGDAISYDFWSGSAHQIWSTSTTASVLSGETRINDTPEDGRYVNRPTTLKVVSLVTTQNVAADAFSRDRGYGRSWWGDLAELVIYDRALSSAERKLVEGYLALKYGLYTPTLHAPEFTPPGTTTLDPVSVEVSAAPGADIRYTTDGSEPTAGSLLYTDPIQIAAPTTLKARAFQSGFAPSPVSSARFLDTVTPAPLLISGLKLWVRSDQGLVVTGDFISAWTDQSGNANHLVQPVAVNQPRFVAEANKPPVVRLDGQGDWLAFTTRLTTIRSVFWVIRANPLATPGFRFLLGDASTYDFCSGDTTKLWSGTYTSLAIRNGETRIDGAPANGLTANRPTNLSVISLVTTANVRADAMSRDRSSGRSWWGDLAELLIYDRPLTAAEVRQVEEYLAGRYGIGLAP